MSLVIIESPYAGRGPTRLHRWWDYMQNVRYGRRCLLDSLRRGEAPFASHLLYTQVLNDKVPDERTMGLLAGQRWIAKGCELVVVYCDRGVTAGMMHGIFAAVKRGIPIAWRILDVAGAPQEIQIDTSPTAP